MHVCSPPKTTYRGHRCIYYTARTFNKEFNNQATRQTGGAFRWKLRGKTRQKRGGDSLGAKHFCIFTWLFHGTLNFPQPAISSFGQDHTHLARIIVVLLGAVVNASSRSVIYYNFSSLTPHTHTVLYSTEEGGRGDFSKELTHDATFRGSFCVGTSRFCTTGLGTGLQIRSGRSYCWRKFKMDTIDSTAWKKKY